MRYPWETLTRQTKPKIVACVIQINTGNHWVSDSPYLHVFDGLERVHHDLKEEGPKPAMLAIGYQPVKRLEHGLPNGKKLLRMDFQHL